MNGRTLKSLGMCLVLLAEVSCIDRAPGEPEDLDELQALLHDEPLTAPVGVPSTAVSALLQPPAVFTMGHWTFDDCAPFRAGLASSTVTEDIAYRSVGVTCAPGVLGQAVMLAAEGDIVYVPDEPYFTFDAGVTVAGWFQPTDLERTQTLFRKRDKGSSSFALVLHRGRFRFVVDLGDGRAASVTAPGSARTDGFQHVAATYDGSALRLYLDGQQVAVREVSGAIPSGSGPLVMGNDGSERRFDGVMDDVVFDTTALTAVQVLPLTCIPAEPTLAVTPAVSDPTPPDVDVSFDIAITNNNPAACPPVDFTLNALRASPNLVVDPFPTFVQDPEVASGTTRHFTLTARPFDTVDTADSSIDFQVFSGTLQSFLFRTVQVAVAEPTGCHVSKSRELLMNDPAVINDGIRTRPGPVSDHRAGAWSFQHLAENMAATPDDAPAMVEDMLRSFTTPQIANGLVIEPRPGMNFTLETWPRTPNGQLDLARAPLRLKAIVNRIDLRNLDHGDAGEGSFIFTFVEPDGFEPDAMLIFEYKLPATSEADVLGWARAFHALGALPFSEAYNAALQAITDRFVQRGARPDGVNGSALHAVRSNELSFGFGEPQWQMREFRLSPATGRLLPVALERTPDQNLSRGVLVDFITANRDALIAGTYDIPDQFAGRPFRAAEVFNGVTTTWFVNGVDPDARSAFALNTCNGCHSLLETGTFFQHVSRAIDGPAALSPFLRGITLPDPQTEAPRTFNDLLRRRADLEAIVCPAEPSVSLRHGISRVH